MHAVAHLAPNAQRVAVLYYVPAAAARVRAFTYMYRPRTYAATINLDRSVAVRDAPAAADTTSPVAPTISKFSTRCSYVNT